MFIELLLLFVTIPIFFYIYSTYLNKSKPNYWTSRGIPYLQNAVTYWEIFTGAKSPFAQNYYYQLKRSGLHFGGIIDMGKPSIFVCCPELLKNVFVKDFDHFTDRRDVNSNDPLVSKLLVTLHGDEWKEVRQFLTPTFTSGKIRRMFQYFNSSSNRLIKYIGSQSYGNSEAGKFLVNIPETSRKFTVDVIGSTVFGVEAQALTNENSIFYDLATKQADPPKSQLLKIMFITFFPRISRLFNLQPFDSELVNYFTNILTQALDARENSNEKRDDFLQLMVEAKNSTEVKYDQNETETKRSKTSLSQEMIIAQCFVFFFAGFDTVANLIGMLLYVLALNMDLQEKVREEVKSCLQISDGQITYESINQMNYFDMFISETQRLYLSVPRLERKCTKSYKIPGSECVIPEGTMVMTDPEAIHNDPSYYDQPEVFNPERFTAENKLKRNAYTFLPFGIGPRNCIGMRFGLIETKVAIAHLLIKFVIQPSDTTPVPLKTERTFNVPRAPKNLQLIFKKI